MAKHAVLDTQILRDLTQWTNALTSRKHIDAAWWEASVPCYTSRDHKTCGTFHIPSYATAVRRRALEVIFMGTCLSMCSTDSRVKDRYVQASLIPLHTIAMVLDYQQ